MHIGPVVWKKIKLIYESKLAQNPVWQPLLIQEAKLFPVKSGTFGGPLPSYVFKARFVFYSQFENVVQE